MNKIYVRHIVHAEGKTRRSYLREGIKLSANGLNAVGVADRVMEDSVLRVDVIGAL